MTQRPKIVVLDGFTLTRRSAEPGVVVGPADPSHPTWETLEALGDLKVYDRSEAHQVIERAENAQVILTNKVPITSDALASLPEVQYIGVLATGVNNVDLEAARERGVVVTNVPAYSTASVAQHVFALLLELVHHTGANDQAARDGTWAKNVDFSFSVDAMTELDGKTLGIVGLGAIGRRVAQIAAAMGMKIAAAHQSSMDRVRVDGVADIRWLTIDDLVAQADVVTLHCPLTPQTHGLINADRLSRMKSTAILINTGRGPLVDEPALAEALHDRVIAGAGLDVLTSEPPPADHPLLAAPRCVISPHVAWATVEARGRLMKQAVANVAAFLNGSPVHRVA